MSQNMPKASYTEGKQLLGLVFGTYVMSWLHKVVLCSVVARRNAEFAYGEYLKPEV